MKHVHSSARQKQVFVRYSLLGCTYVVFAIVVALMFWHHGYTRTDVSSFSNGTITHSYFMLANQSIYQENPGPVTVILTLLAVAILVSSVSLVRRIARGSRELSILGVVVASIIGVVGFLGMLSVGPFILPLAALLLILSTPLDAITPR